uniref:Mannosyl-oligosaccharide glucosidase n=1 Tax=Brugia malayi TaxID=6279 RepID=A0A1I9G524_BRUMA|nr:Bm3361, isoform b [Brugia malayi]
MGNRKRISPRNSPPPQVTKTVRKQESIDFSIGKMLVTVGVVVTVLALGAQYLYVNYYYLPNQISTKSKLPTVSRKSNPRIWGTYRSHLYFGLRARYETSPLFGMMWYRQPVEGQFPQLRHWCEQVIFLSPKYAWVLADGHSFGLQAIHDEPLDIFTDWINDGPVWTARVTTISNVDSNFGYPDFYQELGKVALSNMLGTIGYAHGSNRVQSSYSSKHSLYGPHSLLFTCPSRSVFPRGFLWDEGFHQLLLMKFDPDLSLEIIASWLDTMNVDGWIPREMILGKEAELRVPVEFVVQRDNIANPPMLFYLIEKYLDHKVLKKFYPRLRLWHKWLNSTQWGKKSGTYRWRGRNATTIDELNPRTLPSGLDDYPRATHPTDDEYHVDLSCWMALSARVLSKLAKLAGDSQNEEQYLADYNYLMDLNRFDNLHWSQAKQRYCDYGLHSNSRDSSYSVASVSMKRVARASPKLQLVEDAFGYVSLFPVLLKLLPHDSDKLRIILENIKTERLWSDFGLRSIAPSSPYYKAHNTEHDPPYWRGSIWININYLMLAALKHYSSVEGPNRELAFGVYSDLRNNLVTNVAREFRRTGFLWENYNDETGQGQGAHPFTGWSSLVLSIMAEQYD